MPAFTATRPARNAEFIQQRVSLLGTLLFATFNDADFLLRGPHTTKVASTESMCSPLPGKMLSGSHTGIGKRSSRAAHQFQPALTKEVKTEGA